MFGSGASIDPGGPYTGGGPYMGPGMLRAGTFAAVPAGGVFVGVADHRCGANWQQFRTGRNLRFGDRRLAHRIRNCVPWRHGIRDRSRRPLGRHSRRPRSGRAAASAVVVAGAALGAD